MTKARFYKVEGLESAESVEIRGLDCGVFQIAATFADGSVVGQVTGVGEQIARVSCAASEEPEVIAAMLDEQAVQVPGIIHDHGLVDGTRDKRLELADAADKAVLAYVEELVERDAVRTPEEAAILLRFSDIVYDHEDSIADHIAEDHAEEEEEEEDELDVETGSPYQLAALADAAIEFAELEREKGAYVPDGVAGVPAKNAVLDAARVYGQRELRIRDARPRFRGPIQNAVEGASESPLQLVER